MAAVKRNMAAERIPRATSSLTLAPDGNNVDSYDDILDRAFQIAEERERVGAVDAEDLNGAEEINGSIEQGIYRETHAAPEIHQGDSIYGRVAEVQIPTHPYVIPPDHYPHTVPQPQQNVEQKSRLSAFVCYVEDWETNQVFADVMSLESTLKGSGIHPRIDYREEELRGLNKNKWLEGCMESSVIIVCVSPSFKSIIQSHEQTDDNSVSEISYLMDVLTTKYVHDACRNFKVLPLLIAGAKFMDLPTWLQNTNVYRWPKDSEKLIQRILRLQE